MKVISLLLLLVLSVYTRCLAGTTGMMKGYVRDDHGQPAANVRIKVVSPSKTATRYTDKRGFFVFLDLPPDLYLVSTLKLGTSNALSGGVRINSDQTTFLTVRFNSFHCPAIFRVVGSEQFTSLDVRQMEMSPPNVSSPIIRYPIFPISRGYRCL